MVKKPKKDKEKVKAKGYRDIGVDIIVPKKRCDDRNCPFHGTLSVRGQMIEGEVISDKMQRTVIVEKNYRRYIPKYERYELRTGRYMAHNPPCINARTGAKVKIMECRPLSKTKAFVVIEQKTK
ncbi:MAG: 30S ribosomal protein S17 [Thermoplasmata archaeon]|nr:MAG: 30S ribosomal protein S17 [Thermoplasmata archaeon]